MSSNVHLKGLNGIRIIAAMGVVTSHIGGSLKDFGFNYTWSTYLAGYGVTMFFALSGFLITYLLLVEKTRIGHINIKAFYVRRILRIWPLYYFYLLLAIITIYFFMPAELHGGIFYYIVLFANIPFTFQFSLPLISHYWSLGVEEQFYLFWPWVVSKSKNLLRFLFFFIFIFVAVKLGSRYLDARSSYHWPYQLIHVTRFDCMAIGAVGAILFEKKNDFFLRISYSVIAQLAAWGSILLLAFNKFHLASVIDSEIIAVMTVILIVNVSANPKSLINLEKPIFDFLGKISYGIYVYHPLIIFLTAKWIGEMLNDFNDSAKLVLVFTFIICANILVAYISYEFFEKKFLVLKERFSPVKSIDTIKAIN
jgi:peptidoglycan/LPS O-acetylase OafA/YrhL